MKTNSANQVQIEPSIFAPLIEPLNNPMFLGYFGVLVFLAILSIFTAPGAGKSKVYDGRFANRQEVKAAEQEGLKQIVLGVPIESALKLDTLVLPHLCPAVAVVGGSGSGKTRSFFDPAIKNAIEQAWSIMCFDVKGNLMKKHADYAHSLGYEVYVYAPGFPYSDSLNFLDFLENETDAKAAAELAEVIITNLKDKGLGEGDEFFSPQGISLLKLVFMLAKSSSYPDLFTAWKFLSLDKLAQRLAAAAKYGLFSDSDNLSIFNPINSWIGEASLPLRSVAVAPETSVGIVGSATTHFQKIMDKSIMPCLLKTSMPLELTGKKIIFFQIDEKAQAITSPLVAAAMNMYFYRNLNGQIERDNTLGIFLDEFTSILLPNVESLINRCREYGAVFALGYQSNPQIKMRYSAEYLDSILASCPTQLVFRTGDPNTAEKFSLSLGNTDKHYTTRSRSYGKNSQTTVTSHVVKVRLISPEKITRKMRRGEAIVTNPGFGGYAYRKKIRVLWRNDWLWRRCRREWKKKIRPTLVEQTRLRFAHTTMEREKINREVIAEGILPTVEKLKVSQSVKNYSKVAQKFEQQKNLTKFDS